MAKTVQFSLAAKWKKKLEIWEITNDIVYSGLARGFRGSGAQLHHEAPASGAQNCLYSIRPSRSWGPGKICSYLFIVALCLPTMNLKLLKAKEDLNTLLNFELILPSFLNTIYLFWVAYIWKQWAQPHSDNSKEEY